MRISKAQEKARAVHVQALQARAGVVSMELRKLLAALPGLTEPLNAALRQYNAAAKAATAFAHEVAEELESSIEDKSDRWKEGDAGQAAQSLHEEWQGYDAPELPLVYLLEPELDADPLIAAMHLADLETESES